MLRKAVDNARMTALAVLKNAGITCLDSVPVKIDLTEVISYCEGYDPEENIEIGVGSAQIANYVLGNIKDQTLDELLIHEYGHAFLFRHWARMTSAEKARFRRLFGPYHEDPDGESYTDMVWENVYEYLTDGEVTFEYDDTEFVSYYATTNSHEDWAETFYYVVRDELTEEELSYSRIRAKAQFVEDLIRKYGKR